MQKGKRTGSTNYTDEEVEELFEIFGEEEPMGANDRAYVDTLYVTWARQHKRPMGDADSLKSKLDKL